MIFSKQFRDFIEQQDAFWEGKTSSTHKEKLLARGVKLSEETGEVCDAILGSLNDQRKNKQKQKHSDVGEELADVIIVCGMIARTLNIDINEKLLTKMEKIEKRNNH
jgi:NTP pyrophosphatase (non-canonical NTP hydrolase)